MPGLVGPASYPIRMPEDSKQINGRNVNPVRYPEAGGMSSAAAWHGSGGKKNDMKVEKATSIRAMKDTTGKNVD